MAIESVETKKTFFESQADKVAQAPEVLVHYMASTRRSFKQRVTGRTFVVSEGKQAHLGFHEFGRILRRR